jgi:putative aldouronate transport system permease protein
VYFKSTKDGSGLSRIGLHVILLALSIACLIPLLLVISASFSDEKAISLKGYSLLPQSFTTFAYKYILTEPTQILRAYGTTILVTVIGTMLGLLVSALLAYTISRKDFFLRKYVSFFVFFTMLFSGGLVPSYLIVTQSLHLKNSIWALILPYLVVPFFVLMLRTYFSQIPDPLVESAKIEGAGELRIFFQIIVPLSLPALATVGLFIVLMYWNDFWLALLYMDNSHLYPLQYLLYTIMENINAISANPQAIGVPLPSSSARMAMAVLASGPALLAYLLVQRFFVRGLTIGAIKG